MLDAQRAKEEIQYLQDDNICMRNILNCSPDPGTRAECRMRIKANEDRIVFLKKELSK